MRLRAIALCGLSVLAFSADALLTAGAETAAAAAPKTSLTQVEGNVMCVSCREPLAVAQSPQSYAERAFIRTLVAQGYDEHQIEQALVAQYGPAVLAKPPAHGFNLTVYILPPAILLLGIAVLALTLPRWRRQTRAQAERAPPSATLNPRESERLEQELAHYDG